MDIKAGLSFQIEVSFLDLGNREIPVSKIGDFLFQYYTDSSSAVFEAKRVEDVLTNCTISNGRIIVTVSNFSFVQKGRLKCKMEYWVNDSVLPTSPFKFYCPEQLLDIYIV